jgi:hypothetical protein
MNSHPPTSDFIDEPRDQWKIKSPTRDANARLMDAAPDMLEALKMAREWLAGWASAEPQLLAIDAALSKAEGKP